MATGRGISPLVDLTQVDDGAVLDACRRLGRDTVARVDPERTNRALLPPGGAMVRITTTPWVREDLRAHLAPGSEHHAVPDVEMPPLTVRLSARKTARVRQHAARVHTPAGDVSLWPTEYEIIRSKP
jgi:hypothetical protein